MRIFEKRLGLKRSIIQIDDISFTEALLDLSGMKSCKPEDADFKVIVKDNAVIEDKHEKVIDLTKPRSRIKSKHTGLKSDNLSEKINNPKIRREQKPSPGTPKTSNERQNRDLHDRVPL